jgi:hypothetical protein
MNDSTMSTLLIALIAAGAAATASASATAGATAGLAPAPSASQMARCAAIEARDTRLSCYDALARRAPDEAPSVATTAPVAPAPPAIAAAAAPGPAQAPALQAAQAPATVASVAADPENFGLTAAQTHIADLGPKSEAAHISILSSDQIGQTFVVLDSGQTWTVLDPDGWLSTGDAVTIKRAQLGSYLMFAPSHHSYRVRRIK